MWPGYLTRPGGDRVPAWLEQHGIPLTYLHASGHASVEDLKLLAESVKPDRLIPIHTEAPGQYRRLYPRIEPHADGEWWSV
jgi:ribonuclease J